MIQYGNYKLKKLETVEGVDDIRFRHWFERIQPYLGGYQLWVYGGILEGWKTSDIDATLIGPYDPVKINQILEDIVRITFECSLFPDIKYSIDGKLFHWSEWLKTRETVTCKYAYYKGSMVWNGQTIEWGKEEDGLWVASRNWPMHKQLHKGHQYKDPILLM